MTERERLILEVFAINEKQVETKGQFQKLEDQKNLKLAAIEALKQSEKTEKTE